MTILRGRFVLILLVRVGIGLTLITIRWGRQAVGKEQADEKAVGESVDDAGRCL
jgi:hypothetical protein